MRVAGIVAIVAIVVAVAGCVAGGTASAPPSRSGPPAWIPPAVPTFVDGREVLTVSAALGQRDEGRLGRSAFLLGGFWSVRPFPASCPYPGSDPADLEMYCQFGQGGITERYEAILVIHRDATSLGADPPSGPSLVPWVPPEFVETLRSPALSSGDSPHPPVPIVVAGHFDDARAAKCQPEARQLCRERFVIESIVLFDPASVPPATPSPPPTPFPSPHPPGLFAPEACSGDVPYSFVGWTTTAELDSLADHTGHVWAVVTRDVVLIGDWFEDPNLPPGHYVRGWGRRVCLATERMGSSGMEFSVVNGTAYGEWADGRRTPADAYGPASADETYVVSTPPRLPPPTPGEMQGTDLDPAAIVVRDWSGTLVAIRPPTAAELADIAGVAQPAGVVLLPDERRSVLVVWAECGSDQRGTVTVTWDRRTVIIKGDPREGCDGEGARRAAVFTFSAEVPVDVAAVAGL